MREDGDLLGEADYELLECASTHAFISGQQTVPLNASKCIFGHRCYRNPKPDRAVLSSFNRAEFRIYTDLYETFRFPCSPCPGQALEPA
jgi:hypothetical protein